MKVSRSRKTGCIPAFLFVFCGFYIFLPHMQNKRKGKQFPTLLAARNSKAATDFTSWMFWELLLFFFSIVFPCVSLWPYGATDTSAENRWILVMRRQWRTSTTWWWPATRTGLCLMPSPSKELRNYSMLSLFPRCCQLMNSSPSCMTNIPSTYHNSTESIGKMCSFVNLICTHFN